MHNPSSSIDFGLIAEYNYGIEASAIKQPRWLCIILYSTKIIDTCFVPPSHHFVSYRVFKCIESMAVGCFQYKEHKTPDTEIIFLHKYEWMYMFRIACQAVDGCGFLHRENRGQREKRRLKYTQSFSHNAGWCRAENSNHSRCYWELIKIHSSRTCTCWNLVKKMGTAPIHFKNAYKDHYLQGTFAKFHIICWGMQ